jgi:hypothetical protein
VLNDGSSQRRIRYLACHIASASLLSSLRSARDPVASETERAEFESALSSDACYARALTWTRTGQRDGISPDALLRQGVADE